MQLQDLVIWLMVLLDHHRLKDIVVDDPQVSMEHQEHLEERQETFPLLHRNIAHLTNLNYRQPLLRYREDC